ncbi:uncharacterized protein CLIB1423_04S06370 [[Candida] railenensis]|uniref:Enoyl reductase (ER) domain-containing protein n=1 Tax=[Candida] railenensis TaxID=45579 RepID=A0A9P0QM68_9ASCO|nr:uncharacterized protein CLIB1423_04S06370 [[Candida] railenensis]
MSSKAAVFNGNIEDPFYTIESLPIPSVPKNKILVEGISYAFNPTDWLHILFKLGPAGSVIGSEVSGVVREAGSEVEGFSKGDFVTGWVRGGYEKDVGGFQEFVLLDPVFALKLDKSKIKESILPVGISPTGFIDTWEGAAGITSGLTTAGAALAHDFQLQPQPRTNSEYQDDYLLIWGGSSSVGIFAIQLAKLIYGIKVIVTASKKHAEFLRSIGADAVVDYKSSDAVDQIKKIGSGKIYYALDIIANLETFQAVYDATSATKSGKVIIDNLALVDESSIKLDPERTNVKFRRTLVYTLNGKPSSWGPHIIDPTEEATRDYKHFWEQVLPPYLSKIKHNRLKILEPGLESVAKGLELYKDNKVSGEKVVFRIK